MKLGVLKYYICFLTFCYQLTNCNSLPSNNNNNNNPLPAICETTSHLTGNHFDLKALMREYPHDEHDWLVRGQDFPANFSVNICAPVLAPIKVTDVESPSNVSAYFTNGEDKSIISLGSVSTTPYFRGRSLLLEYKDGSPCMDPNSPNKKTPFRRSSIFTFKCDADLASSRRAVISYVANSNNCTFFFEVRTPHACPKIDKNESVAPITIFLIITLVAVVVYFAGSALFNPRGVLNLKSILTGAPGAGGNYKRFPLGKDYEFDDV